MDIDEPFTILITEHIKMSTKLFKSNGIWRWHSRQIEL